MCRLPSEAEWEAAARGARRYCRANSTHPLFQRRYLRGNWKVQLSCNVTDGAAETAPVGSGMPCFRAVPVPYRARSRSLVFDQVVVVGASLNMRLAAGIDNAGLHQCRASGALEKSSSRSGTNECCRFISAQTVTCGIALRLSASRSSSSAVAISRMSRYS